jgi:hypothetical protein
MTRLGTRVTGLFLMLLMLTSVTLIFNPDGRLTEKNILQVDGRQLGDVDCSNYTFEDMFAYNHALFEVNVYDDWSTTTTNATAWVNQSLAADVREAMDGLFEGFPGGDNDWLSTDEREGVRSVGPKCVSDMTTRIGIREGQPHRGGVDWNELTWVEEGIALDELNLVPDEHAETRDCQNVFASSGCKEVPVHVTDNLEIYLLQAEDDDDPDHNMVYNKLPSLGTQPFTLAMNVTNMTDAEMIFYLPPVEGLRIADFDVQEDGVSVSVDEPTSRTLEDGQLEVTFEINYNLADWPMGKNLFIDFTTAIPPPDYPPTWSATAPAEGASIPMLIDSGKTLLADEETIQSWIEEDAPVDYVCEISNQWILDSENDGIYITPGNGNSDSAELTCTPEWQEKSGENHTGETRTWTLEQPIVFSATAGEYMEIVNITMASNADRSNLSVWITPTQDDATGETASSDGPETESIISTDISVMSPGPVHFSIRVSGANMADWAFDIDLGIIKESRPPEMSITKTRDGDNGTWDSDGYQYTMSGTVFDADGDEVDITIEVCGYDTGVTPDGSIWSADVSVVGCSNSADNYVITLIASDDWGKSTTMTINVPAPTEDDLPSAPSPPPLSNSEEGGGLPAPGLLATIMILAIAGLWTSRFRDD